MVNFYVILSIILKPILGSITTLNITLKYSIFLTLWNLTEFSYFKKLEFQLILDDF